MPSDEIPPPPPAGQPPARRKSLKLTDPELHYSGTSPSSFVVNFDPPSLPPSDLSPPPPSGPPPSRRKSSIKREHAHPPKPDDSIPPPPPSDEPPLPIPPIDSSSVPLSLEQQQLHDMLTKIQQEVYFSGLVANGITSLQILRATPLETLIEGAFVQKKKKKKTEVEEKRALHEQEEEEEEEEEKRTVGCQIKRGHAKQILAALSK